MMQHDYSTRTQSSATCFSITFHLYEDLVQSLHKMSQFPAKNALIDMISSYVFLIASCYNQCEVYHISNYPNNQVNLIGAIF